MQHTLGSFTVQYIGFSLKNNKNKGKNITVTHFDVRKEVELGTDFQIHS